MSRDIDELLKRMVVAGFQAPAHDQLAAERAAAEQRAAVERGFALAQRHFAAMAESSGQLGLAARIRRAGLAKRV